MDFSGIISDIRAAGLAGRRFEKSGHGKFRDCVTVRRDGAFLFERFNYGEAAGKVFEMSAPGLAPDGAIAWELGKTNYSGKDEAPLLLTATTENGSLLFDEKTTPWEAAADLKTMPGMGFFKKLFS